MEGKKSRTLSKHASTGITAAKSLPAQLLAELKATGLAYGMLISVIFAGRNAGFKGGFLQW